MFKFFRQFFKSKIGLAITFAFLGLIALAFASMDVSSSGAFGGVAGGDRVAVVGDQKVGSNDLVQAANNGLKQVQQDNPTLSMQTFLAQGGMSQVLDALIDRFAIQGYAEKYGLRAGDNLVNSEIRQISAFRGANGEFSEEAYRQALRQIGVSDSQVREDLGTGLLSQMLFQPASFGSQVPDKLAYRYAQLFKERRKGSVALLPTALFAPKEEAKPATLKAYYDSHREDFVRPERRVVRYATFDSSALGDKIEPTEAEIAARYKRDAAQYRASETRDVTQLIVPTEAAAKSMKQRGDNGASLEQVAREAGLRASPVKGVKRDELASQASDAVAAAVFSADRGEIAQPARSAIGWHVVRIDAVKENPARSLAQVRGDIADALREEKRAQGLADLATEIEDQFADGATLPEVADAYNLKTSTTKPLLGDGRVYQSAGETAPEVLAPAIATAFQMDEGKPEISPIQSGNTYLIFETTDITPSAVAPYKEIADSVEQRWRQAEGMKRAEAAADRVLKRVRDGKGLDAALKEEKVSLPNPQNVNLTREELARQAERRIPAPLALLFSMAEGTAKKLDAGRDAGFFVVDLDSIAMEDFSKDDPLIAQAKQQLGPLLGQEYEEQMRTAMRDELGVERNPAAIEAVRKRLTGQN